MIHLNFILGAYLVGIAIPLGFGITTRLRLANARTRLASFDPRLLRPRDRGTKT
jgi:hypothetical protein